MISQHWFRSWLGAVRQQAIIWANVNQVLWHHTASLGHNELTVAIPMIVVYRNMISQENKFLILISNHCDVVTPHAIAHLDQHWFKLWFVGWCQQTITWTNTNLLSLTHWGGVTHICVTNQGWRQAIIWTNTGILLIGPLGTKFSEILIEIYTCSFKKMHLKMLSGKCQPFCLSLNMLTSLRILSKTFSVDILLIRMYLKIMHLKKDTFNFGQ